MRPTNPVRHSSERLVQPLSDELNSSWMLSDRTWRFGSELSSSGDRSMVVRVEEPDKFGDCLRVIGQKCCEADRIFD